MNYFNKVLKNKCCFCSLFALFIVFILIQPKITFAQEVENLEDSTKISSTKLAIIGGTTVAFFTYGYVIQNNIWWKNDKSDFHFNNNQDFKYALNADKLGHFYFANLTSKVYSNLFQWSGIDEKNSLFYGGIVALTFQTFTEIRDGFSKGYGFSWGDFSANLLGAAYPSLQKQYPNLEPFNLKVSFYASEKFKNGAYSNIMDDYESTYHWLSVDVNPLLPKTISKYFPDFVNFAIGHSVNNLDGFGDGNHELYLSLDWDFESLSEKDNFLKSILRILDYYHFPAPAIKVYPNVVWYGLKF